MITRLMKDDITVAQGTNMYFFQMNILYNIWVQLRADSIYIYIYICLLFSSEVSSYLPKKLQRKRSMRKAAVKVYIPLIQMWLTCVETVQQISIPHQSIVSAGVQCTKECRVGWSHWTIKRTFRWVASFQWSLLWCWGELLLWSSHAQLIFRGIRKCLHINVQMIVT